MPLDAAPLDTKPEIVPSTCPHDCPSTCALDVERLDAHTIGRVHGAKSNDYTAGVVCAKVARYAERVHHPARLTRPLRRVGNKGEGIEAFQPIGWDEALDEVAGRLKAIAEEWGSEAVWPYFYAGTMGLVQRDGIDRLRHAMRYSRQHSTFCNTLADAGWLAGVGVKYGVDPREMQDADLIVVWGGNPVNTQVNVMTHIARARKNRGRPAGRCRSLPHRHGRTGRHASGAAAGHRRGAGLRHHAYPVPRRPRRPGLSGEIRRLPGGPGSPSAKPRPGLGSGNHRPDDR